MDSCSHYFIIRAGIPAAIEYGGIFFVTTAFAPMMAPSPIVTPAKIGFLPDPHIVSDDDRTFGINRPGIRCDVPERHIFGISVRIVRNEHAFPRADVLPIRIELTAVICISGPNMQPSPIDIFTGVLYCGIS